MIPDKVTDNDFASIDHENCNIIGSIQVVPKGDANPFKNVWDSM
jgi:hypothetical protein